MFSLGDFRVRLSRFFMVVLCLFVTGCGMEVKVTDTQDIPVTAYDDPAANMELATSLVQLPPDYFQANVPALRQVDDTNGVRVASFQRDSDQHVFLRITYQKDNKSVAENSEALRQQFSAFIPGIIQDQVEAKDLFEEIRPVAREIAIKLFENAPRKSFEDAAPLLHYYTAEKPFVDALDSGRKQYGRIVDLTAVRSAILRPYGQVTSNVIVQDFNTSTSSGKSMFIRLSLIQVGEGWKMLGFHYQQIE